jgi:hypothetical protein
MPRAVIVTILSIASLFAQQPVDPSFLYHRIWATVPMVGVGTAADPIRPMFTPKPVDLRAARARIVQSGRPVKEDRPGIIGMQTWISDDGKTALVEFVAADPSAFNEIRNSKAPGVKIFERGKTTKDEVEREFRKLKRDFSLSNDTVRVP